MTENYASLVDNESVRELFEKLVKYYGNNRKKAAEECGIARKSVYDWLKLKNEIKVPTKERVLVKSLETMPLETFDLLMRRLSESSAEILIYYLTTIYEKAFDNDDDFLKWAQKFIEVSEKYGGVIYKKVDFEVEDLLGQLKNQSKSLNIDWSPPSIHLQIKQENTEEDRIRSTNKEILNLVSAIMPNWNIPLNFVNVHSIQERDDDFSRVTDLSKFWIGESMQESKIPKLKVC